MVCLCVKIEVEEDNAVEHHVTGMFRACKWPQHEAWRQGAILQSFGHPDSSMSSLMMHNVQWSKAAVQGKRSWRRKLGQKAPRILQALHQACPSSTSSNMTNVEAPS